MTIIDTNRSHRNHPFDVVADPLVVQPGLPFAEVLTAEAIEDAFADNKALFGQDDIFSTPIVL